MSHKINVKAKTIQDAFGVSTPHVDDIADKLALICGMAQEGKKPAGYVADKVTEMFSQEDLQVIATMFIIRVINENNDEDECDCAACRAARGEDVSQDEVMKAIQDSIEEKFPGMEAMVVKVPRDPKGKTNC